MTQRRRVNRLDPADLVLRGRIGAHLVHARHDGRVLTAPARAAFLARFERSVDPEDACRLTSVGGGLPTCGPPTSVASLD